MSERTRRDRCAGAVHLLARAPGEQPAPARGYAFGRAHARVTTQAVVLCLAFLAIFVLALGHLIFVVPGLLGFTYVWNRTRPVRGVLVNDRGVVVLEIGVYRWRARSVIAQLPFEAVLAGPARADPRPTIVLGPDSVTFGRREYRRLIEAARIGHQVSEGTRGPDVSGRHTDAAR